MSYGSAHGRATLVTAVAQLASPLVGAFLGAYIGLRFRVGPATTAFFFSYTIYGLVVFVAQSMRTTAISGLMVDGSPDRARLAAYLRAVALVALFTAASFAALGTVLVPAFLTRVARPDARLCLLLLLPAGTLQLLAGLLAASLATHGDFTAAALGYLAGAVAAVIAAVSMATVIGVVGLASGFAFGSFVSVLIMILSLRRRAWPVVSRPQPTPSPSAYTLALRIAAGAGAIVAPQIIVSSNVIFATRGGPAAVTAMAYAQMAVSLLNTGLTSPVMTVYAPVVSRTFRHDIPALLKLSDRAYRASALLTPFAVAGLYLLGQDPSRLLLAQMSHREVARIFQVMLLLSPNLLITQALMIPMLGVLTSERFVARAAATLSVAAVHVALCWIATSLSPHTVVALSFTSLVSGSALALVDMKLAFGSDARRAVRNTALATVQISVVGGAVYLLWATLLSPGANFALSLVTFGIGSLAYMSWLGLFQREPLLDLVHSFRPVSR